MTPAELGRAYHVPNPDSEEEPMPSVAQVRRWLTLTALPIGVGAASNWLVVHVHLFAAFHVSQRSVAAELTQLGVFGITSGLAFLASHHILKGSYAGTGSHVLGSASLELKPVLAQGIKRADPAPPVVVHVHNTAASPAVVADAPAPAAPAAAVPPPPAA